MDKGYQFLYKTERTVAYAATVSIEQHQSQEVIKIDQTGDMTVELDSANSNPLPGDEIILVLSSDGTGRTTTFGTGFQGPNLVGTANKTNVVRFIYHEGMGKFIQASTAVQID